MLYIVIEWTPSYLFKIEDQVYLKANYIRSLRSLKKLDNCKYSLFVIIDHINSRTYRLKLPLSLKIYNIFNANTLILFKESIINDQPKYL